MNAACLLSERAAGQESLRAILDHSRNESRALTFAQLERASSGAAARLWKAGLRTGDSVLVFEPMTAELYVALNALFRLGLVAMFVDPSAGAEHLASCCAANPPKGFIGSPKAHWWRLISPSLRRIPIRFSTGRPLLGAPSLVPDEDATEQIGIVPCSPDTPALIRFTSGSTGRPKTAVRTHGFLLAQQQVLQKSLRLVPGEVELATMPVFVLANLASGVTSWIPHADLRAPGRIDPAPLARQIRAQQPQRVTASPAFLERLADFCRQTSQRLDSFQTIHTGGAPVFPHLLEKLHGLAPRARLVAVYGSTEAEPIAQVSYAEISEADREAMWSGRGLLAGLPDPAIQVRILGEDSGESSGELTEAAFAKSCQPAGEPGQIVVSGPHVQPGYLNGVGDGETKLRVHGTTWHQTGDAGYFDARGRLWLLGRCSARIRDRRGTLYPFQVECAACRDPRVRRAALWAHEGKRVLVVELRAKATRPDFEEEFAWAGIDRVHLVRRLPVDPRHNAKVDYGALKQLLQGF